MEACGYLAGRLQIADTFYPLTNAVQSGERFSFDPKEQFRIHKQARAQGLEIYAVYHSHPASTARPSAEDIRQAHDPGKLHVIISLAGGREDVKTFRIQNAQVTEVETEIV